MAKITFNPFTGNFDLLNTLALAAVGSSPNANGASVNSDGSILTLQPADGTNPGVMTAGTQTLGGNKTFTGTLAASNLSGTNTGDVTLTAVGAVPNANGASLSGQALTLQPANASFPGVLTAADWSTFNGKANASLNNLASTAVNADILPSATNVHALGSSGLRWSILNTVGLNTSADASIHGVTVGLGGSSLSTNVALGASVLSLATSGADNLGAGYGALAAITTGAANVGIGKDALAALDGSNYNTAVGYRAAFSTLGQRNVAVGAQALFSNTTAQDCVAVGTDALSANLQNENVAIGAQALLSNTTGGSNLAIGYRALVSCVTSNYNVAVGRVALQANIGSLNTAVGAECMISNTSGAWNSAYGVAALNFNQTGVENVAVGAEALYASTGSYNSGLGRGVLPSLNTGDFNIGIGYHAGLSVGSADSCIFLGVDTSATGTRTNAIAIGRAAIVAADNAMCLGDIGAYALNVGVGVPAPTARMHLPGSNASAGTGSLKVDAGTLLTTPEAGVIESDSGGLYWTSATPTRKLISGLTARYNNSSTTISGTLTKIVWTNQNFDDFSIMASGTITIPANAGGDYQVNAGVALTGTVALNDLQQIYIYVNGSAYTGKDIYSPAALTDTSLSISDIVRVAAGGTIEIFVASASTTPSIVSSTTKNYVSVSKVG